MTQIVVIRDRLSTCDLLGHLLAEDGWHVQTRSNSRRTYRNLRKGNQDLIILDIPGGDSGPAWDLLTLLHLDPELRCAPVIVCSPISDDLLSREEWLHGHGVSIVPKPFELNELQVTVRDALGYRNVA